MTTSQYKRYMNNKTKEIDVLKRVSDPCQPSWQVKYEDYGGLKLYTTIRNMYWGISSYYIDVEGRYDATNFPLTGYEEGITNLLKQFRKDLVKPIHYYND